MAALRRALPPGAVLPDYEFMGGPEADGGGRGIDLLSPVWSVLDLLPEGRGE